MSRRAAAKRCAGWPAGPQVVSRPHHKATSSAQSHRQKSQWSQGGPSRCCTIGHVCAQIRATNTVRYGAMLPSGKTVPDFAGPALLDLPAISALLALLPWRFQRRMSADPFQERHNPCIDSYGIIIQLNLLVRDHAGTKSLEGRPLHSTHSSLLLPCKWETPD